MLLFLFDFSLKKDITFVLTKIHKVPILGYNTSMFIQFFAQTKHNKSGYKCLEKIRP